MAADRPITTPADCVQGLLTPYAQDLTMSSWMADAVASWESREGRKGSTGS